jgi:hypothetical protein
VGDQPFRGRLLVKRFHHLPVKRIVFTIAITITGASTGTGT